MSRIILLTALALAVAAPAARSQATDPGSPEIPENMRAKKLPRQNLSGPRFGFTTFTGDLAQLRSQAGLSPMISQFGWQWETQLVSSTGGYQALMEWVALLGGLGQETVRPTLSWITGIRLQGGVEFGVGPNFGWDRDKKELGTGIVIAAGATIPAGDLYVPVNLAVTTAEGGPRITALVGWVVGW